MKKSKTIICSFLFSVAMQSIMSQQAIFPSIIRVDGGLISGINSPKGNVHIFKAIPFAAPPTGNLRWKEPQPVIPWKGIRKCDRFAASPMQSKPVPFGVYTSEFLIPAAPIDEDCLYLNVWTQAELPHEKRPVIIWIYGGGFRSGGSGVPIYDGEAMAKKGIVFVSINYRVGIFGFFAHPELTNESGRHASGNYGLMDQIAAIKWVKKNIAAFGGDPGNITIAGQSAGSMSVNCLVASPLCLGLFQHAIAESGAMFISGMMHAIPLKQAEEQGVAIAKSLNVTSLQELRKVSADDIVKQMKGFSSIIIDGYVLPEPVADIFASGKQNEVEVITGWNSDDGVLFTPLKNAADFKKQAMEQYGAAAETFLKYYPARTDSQAAASQVALNRDLTFGIQNYTWAKTQSQKGKSKIYLYNFNRKVPATAEFVKYGAFHTGEVAYAYDNLKFEHRPWQPSDYALASQMSAYWVNFAYRGNPNGRGLPQWPAYSPTGNSVMTFDVHSQAKSLPTKAQLDFLITQVKK